MLLGLLALLLADNRVGLHPDNLLVAKKQIIKDFVHPP